MTHLCVQGLRYSITLNLWSCGHNWATGTTLFFELLFGEVALSSQGDPSALFL